MSGCVRTDGHGGACEAKRERHAAGRCAEVRAGGVVGIHPGPGCSADRCVFQLRYADEHAHAGAGNVSLRLQPEDEISSAPHDLSTGTVGPSCECWVARRPEVQQGLLLCLTILQEDRKLTNTLHYHRIRVNQELSLSLRMCRVADTLMV